MTLRENLKENIKQQRLEAKLNFKEFAEILGVSEQTARFWESGDRAPELRQIEKMAEVFGKPAWDYFQVRELPEDRVIVPKADWENYLTLKRLLKVFASEEGVTRMQKLCNETFTTLLQPAMNLAGGWHL